MYQSQNPTPFPHHIERSQRHVSSTSSFPANICGAVTRIRIWVASAIDQRSFTHTMIALCLVALMIFVFGVIFMMKNVAVILKSGDVSENALIHIIR